MAYESYLFRFGDYIFPNKYIKFDSYDIAPNQRQDKNSFTNGNGGYHPERPKAHEDKHHVHDEPDAGGGDGCNPCGA